jgi:hypothetical protein
MNRSKRVGMLWRLRQDLIAEARAMGADYDRAERYATQQIASHRLTNKELRAVVRHALFYPRIERERPKEAVSR